MRRAFLISALLLGFVSPAWAGILSGAKAYRSGDYTTALEEFRRLADQGVPLAQFALGQMYAEGAGVARDFDEAVKWYGIAAANGLAHAQYNLGVAHYTGIGAPRDYLRAARWYEKAARQGDARSQNNLGYLYESGKGVKQDLATSVEWYRLAAEGGNMNAQVNLGNAYRLGRGVEADHDLAIAWLRKAVDKWDTSDPLKLWIVESPQSIKPYSESVGAPRAVQIAQDIDLLEDQPATRIAGGPLPEQTVPAEAARVETVEEIAGETVTAAVEAAEVSRLPTVELVVEVAALSGNQPASSKRQYDLAVKDAEQVSVSDGFRVQLGAFKSPKNADKGWRQLLDALPDILGEMKFDTALYINKVDLGSEDDVMYTVQTKPFAEEIDAAALCSQLKSLAVDCFLVRP